ncbi:hypothetical protein [Methylomonas albis]|nr:hypothetical protein [Methylomonas albis]
MDFVKGVWGFILGKDVLCRADLCLVKTARVARVAPISEA